jgi:hypothetical protein
MLYFLENPDGVRTTVVYEIRRGWDHAYFLSIVKFVEMPQGQYHI